MKRGVAETIGVPYATDNTTEVNDTSFMSGSILSSTASAGTLWRNRRRGMSFENEIGCDEIME